MAQAKLLGYVHVVAHGQDATRGLDAPLGYDHGAIVEGRVLEKHVLYEQLVDIGVYQLARLHYVVERRGPLYHDERAHLAFGHVHARPDDGHDGLLVGLLRAVAMEEQVDELCCPLPLANLVEKLAYLILEEDDKANDAYRHELVHDASEKAHLQDLGEYMHFHLIQI